MDQNIINKKILIIDDNEFIRGSIARLLETVGYKVSLKSRTALKGLSIWKMMMLIWLLQTSRCLLWAELNF